MKILVYPEASTVITSISNGLLNSLIKEFNALKSNPKDSIGWDRVKQDLIIGSTRIALHSYRDGCREVNVSPDAGDVIRLRRDVVSRINKIVPDMKDWTLSELGLNASSSKAKLLGKKRAKKTIDNETRVTFYNSRKEAWRRNREARKEWVLGNEHGNLDDICDENADDGPIEVNDAFSAGDLAPPAHIGCYCRLFLHLPQNLLRQPDFGKEHLRVI